MAKRQTKKAALGSAWNKARETSSKDSMGDFVPVGAGAYVMQLCAAEVGTFNDMRKLWTKWCVIQAEDDEDLGKICNEFEGIETDERLVWVQRQLVALGVDLDETEIETEDDLVAVYHDLILDNCCARVKVTEKDGYTNLRIQKRIEVEEEMLVDPEQALSGGGVDAGSSKKSTKSAKTVEEDDDGDEVEVGARVTWGDGRVGEIVSFKDDDTAMVKEDGKRKPIAVALEDLDFEDAEDAEDEDAEDEDEYAFNEGDLVQGTFDGEVYEGEVTSAGNDSVEVDFGDGPAVYSVKKHKIALTSGDEEDDEDEDGDDEDDEDGGDEESEDEGVEFEKGDAVLFTVRGKENVGTIVSVNASAETVKVKDESGKTHTLAFDDVDLATDD